jgi:hypothetical protein
MRASNTERNGTPMLDDAALAAEARDSVRRAINRKSDALLSLVAQILRSNSDLDEDSVKAAIVSLLNQGELELTPQGELQVVKK